VSNAVFLGVDIGSLSTDAVIVDRDGRILASAILPTGARAARAAERAREQVLAQAGAASAERTIATGYGRSLVHFADKAVTEISCHARGIHQLLPDVRTLIDVGGQDSKAIRLGDNGRVMDFAMNDKCAAGTGRFLEVMARALEVPLEEMGARALRSTHAVEISSMCTVFAESEVVTRIAEGCEVNDVLAGIHRAIASRTASLVKRVRPKPPMGMSGGVAHNPGVVAALQEATGQTLAIPDEPQIVGALGAALLASELQGGRP
jgi:predicted CoA-substrate-specific enzyme activase